MNSKSAPEPLDSELLDILVCPEDKGRLWYFQDEQILYNPRLKRKYLIRDSIPVMLTEEAESAEEPEHKRLCDLAAEMKLDEN